MAKEIKQKKSWSISPPRNLSALLSKYTGMIVVLVLLTIIANGLSISVPKMVAQSIDTYASGSFTLSYLVIEFSVVAVFIFFFTYLQNIAQVYISERVARDIRSTLIEKISMQSYAYVENVTPEKLLTHLTSDVDAVKVFVSTAVSSLISSAFLIIAVSTLLLLTDLRLALVVLSIMPIIGLAFFVVLRKVRKLFLKAQEAIDWLNRVIGESIVGASLMRILDAKKEEKQKFVHANTEARDISFGILKLFSSLIPVITLLTYFATLAIVVLGGYFVIEGDMSLGNFTAFNSYLAILIFPILILGFISNLITRAQVSYRRILKVLEAPLERRSGTLQAELRGDVEVKNVSLKFGEKWALKNVSLSVSAGSKIAIIGPSAAGKTQLLYLLSGLLLPTEGSVQFDGKNISQYEAESFRHQVGFVFQESFMFNLSLRENIALSDEVGESTLQRAIDTAELTTYIATLPEKLETSVSERGTSLSGGQKQRIMLARALALDPKVLLLDDFTARVDINTERKILKNIAGMYPKLTLISVTQRISSIEHYDQIILLMQGEVVARGTHEELIHSSPEYIQIYESQKSMRQYEEENAI